jgi:hypothetical protein
MFRVDNGAPWGSCNDLPPLLSLWLIGLGIDIHWNTPGRPQENGVIERSQGLALRWAEPKQCPTLQTLQQRLNHEDCIQRERYPAIDGQPRLTAYPELRKGGRSYSYHWEKAHWDWSRVLEHLSEYVVVRRVDSSGKIGNYGVKLYVGKLHRGSTVYVQFDPDQIAWIITDAKGQQLRQVPAQLTASAIRKLPVHNRTSTS